MVHNALDCWNTEITEIVVSNPAWGRYFYPCYFCVCLVLCNELLAIGLSVIEGIILNVKSINCFRIKVRRETNNTRYNRN
jgi:hypothetical protein